jgi:hypothetical protein
MKVKLIIPFLRLASLLLGSCASAAASHPSDCPRRGDDLDHDGQARFHRHHHRPTCPECNTRGSGTYHLRTTSFESVSTGDLQVTRK